ncbi:lamin tail domain-containing protein [Candidatus Saccharibacteria bacterium]|nr:lamin tail domain-containing protein [Candidatus Saccharibacteria bacterium]
MKKLRCLIIAISLVAGLVPRDIVMATGEILSLEEITQTKITSEKEQSEDKADEDEELSEQDVLLATTQKADEESDEKIEGVRGGVVIKSFNPGFTNIGEFLELARLSKNDLSLAGLSIKYTTSSGKEYVVYDFLDGYEMVGESLLMRLASSSEVSEAEDISEVADLSYVRNMSQTNGKIELVFDEEIVDSLCWGEGEGCFSAFNSKKPTTLVRNFEAEEMEELFYHDAEYAPSYDKNKPGLKITEPAEELVEPKCQMVEFSEVLTYFENANAEQFVELFNRGEEEVELSGCFLKYKNKNYSLSGEIKARGYLVFYPMKEWGLSLTKNPVSSNTLEIIDADGSTVDILTYYSGQKKGVSLAMVGYKNGGSENWVQTYTPTPGEENNYQGYKTCPVGKVINLETGNCVNETTLSTTLVACPAGKYRNPLTGRCKSYATETSSSLKPCAEGYERNPETGRCRKIVKNDGADYAIETETFEEKTEFVAIWAIIVVIVMGIIYIIYQYKDDIKRKLGK